MNDENPIKITSDDVVRVVLPPAAPIQEADRPPCRDYGSIADARPSTAGPTPGVIRRSWFYLGLAGLLGSLAAWAVVEPFIVRTVDGNLELFTGLAKYAVQCVVVLTCLGFAVAESVVEHSPRKLLQRGAVALVLGTLLGGVLSIVGDAIMTTLHERLVRGSSHPLVMMMVARSSAWFSFGLASGCVYGVADWSARKCLYGILGGLGGAGLGGMLFDPISEVTGGGALSRALGFSCFGVCYGVAMGLVEGALKDRWLHVSGGPLAGKQFILYKPRTIIGSQQSADIYLFKDPSILPAHAVLELRGSQVLLTASEPVGVNGLTTQQRSLRAGDQIQIGRYAFEYREKRQSA